MDTKVRKDDPGQMHNELLKRFYGQHRADGTTKVTFEFFQETTKELGAYLTEFGYKGAEVEKAITQDLANLQQLELFPRGTLRPQSEYLPLIVNDIIARGSLSPQLAKELQALTKLALNPKSSMEALRDQINQLEPTADDRSYVQTLQSVANASYDFWNGSSGETALKLKDSSNVIIMDAYGALIGAFYPAPGISSIIVGAVFSVAANEASATT